jgi:hypothetical protein
MCSKKCEIPLSDEASSREPTRTNAPTAAVRNPLKRTLATVSPFASLTVRKSGADAAKPETGTEW